MTSFSIVDKSGPKRQPKGYVQGITSISVIKNEIVIDYIEFNTELIRVYIAVIGTELYALPSVKKDVTFSNANGIYIIPEEWDKMALFNHINCLGHDKYPYSFAREYEAVKHFNLFKSSAKIVSDKIINDSIVTNKIKYTFGLEFETSMGFIPEEECYINGLIPLRDGSITGTEYSTIVLNEPKKNLSTNLLQQQLLALKKYCVFNKECALHIHMGGFPVEPNAIFILHTVERILESSLYSGTLPRYSFNTSKYKRNGKDYCKKVDAYYSFEDLYRFYARQEYYGDLTQPHPNDTSRERKWQIETRYYGLNLINMLCYNSSKTVEFRFLRPTWNYRKIRLWLLIFNAVLQYSENLYKEIGRLNSSAIIDNLRSRRINLEDIIVNIYDKKLADVIINDINILKNIVQLQCVNNDYCGQSVDLEDKLFPDVI